MGIPKLFRWLTDQYPSINQRINEGLKDREVDNFYLDMNGIIHMCTHANSEELVLLDEQEMLKRIFIYTDRLFKIVKPTRLMFLAVDGPAPRAKMNQQRARRFRAAKEREALMAELVAQGNKIPDKQQQQSFDSNCITPGTEFMYKLGKAFNKWIEFKMANDPFWQEQGARVIFSGPDVPGEGEHKVMDYIREARATELDWREGMSHCMYGLDADLIMLSLVTHEPNFFLLREKMSVRHARGGKKPKDPLKYAKQDFELLEIKMLRDMLHLQFRSLSDKLPFQYSLPRVVDDFVFMCMFVGNDFLPNVPHLDIADGALNTMISIYREMLPELGGYLTDKAAIHRGRFELLMAELARREPLYFMQRGREEQDAGFANPSDPLAYRDYYYKVKLGFAEDDAAARRQLVACYLEVRTAFTARRRFGTFCVRAAAEIDATFLFTAQLSFFFFFFFCHLLCCTSFAQLLLVSRFLTFNHHSGCAPMFPHYFPFLFALSGALLGAAVLPRGVLKLELVLPQPLRAFGIGPEKFAGAGDPVPRRSPLLPVHAAADGAAEGVLQLPAPGVRGADDARANQPAPRVLPGGL